MSGDADHHGRITKQGSKHLRSVLVRSAHVVSTPRGTNSRRICANPGTDGPSRSRSLSSRRSQATRARARRAGPRRRAGRCCPGCCT
ncbi:MAG: transposase [Nannocystaceae bacterium]